MMTALQRDVCEANLELVRQGLVVQTWGNVSGVDRAHGLMVIKPSGVPYERLKPKDMVVVSLATGRVVAGKLRPSSDTPTHLVLYRTFKKIGGIAHSHSLYATAWAQAGAALPVLGTTHADYWRGPVPCARPLRPAEVKTNYEQNTGHAIAQAFRHLDPLEVPAALVANHGPFAWGRDAAEAVQNAAVLEFTARLASETLRINPRARAIDRTLLDTHFSRKHGPGSYYGQKSSI
jgi:L-ribulose-5-phosphate 4-epimerase